MSNKITDQISKDEYTDLEIVENYVNAVKLIGLWNSEQIIFSEYVKCSDKILDIGCGAGRTTFNMYKLGYTNIIGFDYSINMISACNRLKKVYNANLDFICGDAKSMPFQDSTFDVCIFSFNGLMSIPQIDERFKVFKEVFRLLKSNGIFIFTTHNIKNPIFDSFGITEKERWNSQSNDFRLREFGNIISFEPKAQEFIESFMHIPTYEEIYNEAKKAGFTSIKKIIRSEMDCTEKEHVLLYSGEYIFTILNMKPSQENMEIQKLAGDCIFWICSK